MRLAPSTTSIAAILAWTLGLAYPKASSHRRFGWTRHKTVCIPGMTRTVRGMIASPWHHKQPEKKG